MNENECLVKRFYYAFSQRDAEGMVKCYHPQVHFSDPVFDLHNESASQMWRMLCKRGLDLRVEYRDIQATGPNTVSAHWEAWYTFSQTGRQVHNVIDAQLEIEGGLIKRHIDDFDFWVWSQQALGPMGWLLGWSNTLKNKVRAKAAHGLDLFENAR